MEITIFKELTTEGVIASIEENSKKYHDGFYADMKNAPERKLVKESASEIGGIIKDIKASGIKIRKAKIAEVNREEAAIVERLEKANLPFTKLIDDYAAERKIILDAEKAEKKAREDAAQLECDHEIGLILNEKFDLDQASAALEKIEHEEKIKAEAIKEQAAQAERDRIANKQALAAAETKRLADIKEAKQRQIDLQLTKERDAAVEAERKQADVKHAASVHNTILAILVANGISDLDARTVIKLAAKNELPHIQINY